MTSSRRRIGIFGGAFNPVHLGHLAIARSFLESRLIHELWILPTPDPPHKEIGELVPFHHRLEMLKRAFRQEERVLVSDLERDLPTPSYTWKTLATLQKRYTDHRLFLCIGEDSLLTFTSWYRWQEILERVPLLVAERPGYDREACKPEILHRTLFAEHQPVEISSTAIREAIHSPYAIASLPTAVHTYIEDHRLYTREGRAP